MKSAASMKQRNSAKCHSRVVLNTMLLFAILIFVVVRMGSKKPGAVVYTEPPATKKTPHPQEPHSAVSAPSLQTDENVQQLRSGAVDLKTEWPSPDNNILVKKLRASQFPASCANKTFLLFHMPKNSKRDTRNMGAMFTTLWRWAVVALEMEAVLVVNSTDWNMAHCPNNQNEIGGLTCYFEPLSSCTTLDVLASAPASEHFLVPDLEPESILKALREHKVVVTTKVYSPLIKTQTYQGLTLDRNNCQVMSAVVGYFLRLTPTFRAIIEDNIAASLPANFDPRRALGMPIRGSDKCNGHNISNSARGEMNCIPFLEYMKHAEKIRAKNPEVNTIILTSEDPLIVQESKDWAVGPENSAKWRFVYNSRDVLQGTGSSTEVTATRDKTLSQSDVAASMLTSLHLQLRPKFLITHFKSSFLLLMGVFHDNCESCNSLVPLAERQTTWLFRNSMCIMSKPLQVE